MIILTKLILAHLIGDFFLQPNSWVAEKEIKKLASPKLYLHCIIHGGLVAVLLWDFHLWPIPLAISLAHLVIDAAKLVFQQEKTKRKWFVIDQLLHILSIIMIYAVWQTEAISFPALLLSDNFFIYTTAFAALTLPTSYTIKTIISKWAPHTGENDDESLQDAGKYIGILERLFVLVFVISGHWDGIGFLIAAKSVFRFGDLKESKDRKLTEYILIGTLLSFGVAIGIGIVVASLTSK